MIKNTTVIDKKNIPNPIGPYSQAKIVTADKNLVFLSGQIGLKPNEENLISENFDDQVYQAFKNVYAIARSVNENSSIIKLTLFLTDIKKFVIVNKIMEELFTKPFPARSTVEVNGLPKGAQFEVEATLIF